MVALLLQNLAGQSLLLTPTVFVLVVENVLRVQYFALLPAFKLLVMRLYHVQVPIQRAGLNFQGVVGRMIYAATRPLDLVFTGLIAIIIILYQRG